MLTSTLPVVYVSDLGRAVKFYTETLGLDALCHIPDKWATIAAPDKTFVGLHPASEHGPKPGARGAMMVSFSVNRPLGELVPELEKRGIQFEGPIIDDEMVRLAFFADPDGNPLCLCEYNG